MRNNSWNSKHFAPQYSVLEERIIPDVFPLFTFPAGVQGWTFVECKQCRGMLFRSTSDGQVRCIRCDSYQGRLLWKQRTRLTVPVK